MLSSLFLFAGLTTSSALTFTHGWDTSADSTFADFRTTELWTEAEADFAAEHYRVVSVEKCTGVANGGITEDGVYHTAQQLKKRDPSIKVFFYWATDQQGIQCYGANEEWIAHPEWQLLNDDGTSTGVLDTSNAEGVKWWVNVPLSGQNGTGLYNGQKVTELIDGVLADSGGYSYFPGIADITKLQKQYDTKLAMMGQLQAVFTSVNGGQVMANGISSYGVPHADARRPGDHNIHALDFTNAIMAEHTAVFECINSANASFNLDTTARDLEAIIEATQVHNGSKTVFVQTWPGMYVSTAFIPSGSTPASVYPPGGDPTPQSNQEWREALTKYFPFAHALYLSIAEPNMYWMYAGYWYESHTGYLPCPDDLDSCAAPVEWFPDLKKPLGKPLGPRVETAPGSYVWDRQFEHASVHLDLNQPNASKVVFNSDRMAVY